MKKKTAPRVSIVAIPLRAVMQRLAVLFMIAVSITLLTVSKTNNDYVRYLRAGVTDILIPVVGAVSAPVDAFYDGMHWLRDMANLRDENMRLRHENMKLMQWQSVATELENENEKLRGLLQFAPANKEAYTSARVAVDGSGPYVKSVLVNAGSSMNVQNDLAVINENGLVGRVVEVNPKSSRVLLLTDINSRVPVMTETSRERAIAAGDNTDMLGLRYLPEDSKIQVGERIVTTSDGGVLPPGLPVGVVSSIEGGVVKVRPLVDWYRLEYVSIVDFSM